MQNKIPHILIAESNGFVRLGLRTLIENYPSLQLLAETNNLDDLFELASKNKPEVILFDLSLDYSNCAEHIAQLLLVSPHSRLLAFSNYYEEQIHLDALRAGAAGIFGKHQSIELLLKAIHAVNAGQVWFDGQIDKQPWQSQFSQSLIAPTNRSDTAKNQQQCLNVRECNIACLASKGLPAKKIAEQLYVSEKTIRNQLTVVYEKLGVKSQISLCLKLPSLHFCRLPDQSMDRDNCPNKKNKYPPKKG